MARLRYFITTPAAAASAASSGSLAAPWSRGHPGTCSADSRPAPRAADHDDRCQTMAELAAAERRGPFIPGAARLGATRAITRGRSRARARPGRSWPPAAHSPLLSLLSARAYYYIHRTAQLGRHPSRRHRSCLLIPIPAPARQPRPARQCRRDPCCPSAAAASRPTVESAATSAV